MSDQFEAELGTEHDDAGEGVMPPDGQETAAPQADQAGVESQTDSGGQGEPEEIDLSQPMFAYGDQEITGEQIVEALDKMGQFSELETKLAQMEAQMAQTQQQGPQGQQPPGQIEGADGVRPVDWSQTGEFLDRMLQGDEEVGGLANIGPALRDANIRQVLTDPDMQSAVFSLVDHYMEQRQTRESFTKDFGDIGSALQDGSLAKWKNQNPAYRGASNTEAFLAMQIQNLNKQLSEVQSGKAQAVKDAETQGKKAGEAATVKNLRAKGTLRPLARSAGVRQPGKPQGLHDDIKAKYDLTDPDQRARAMAEGLERMRSQGR